MVVKVLTGQFQKPTGANGTTLEVSVSGYFSGDVKCIIFSTADSISGRIASNSTAASGPNFIVSIGFCNTSGGHCVSAFAMDNAAIGSTGAGMNSGRILQVAWSGGLQWDAAMNLISGNAFQVAFPTNNGSASLINYWALGGTDISGTSIAMVNIPTSTGLQSTTTPAFKPDFLMTLAGWSGNNVGWVSGMMLSVGYATHSSGLNQQTSGSTGGSGNGISASWWSLNNNTTMRCAFTCPNVNRAVETPLAAGQLAADASAEFYGFTANGFDLNWVDAAATANKKFAYLAIQGGSWTVGNHLKQSGTQPTTEAFVGSTGLSGQTNISGAKGMMLISVNFSGGLTGSGIMSSGHNTIGFGFATSGKETCIIATENTGQGTSQCSNSTTVIGTSGCIANGFPGATNHTLRYVGRWSGGTTTANTFVFSPSSGATAFSGVIFYAGVTDTTPIVAAQAASVSQQMIQYRQFGTREPVIVKILHELCPITPWTNFPLLDKLMMPY